MIYSYRPLIIVGFFVQLTTAAQLKIENAILKNLGSEFQLTPPYKSEKTETATTYQVKPRPFDAKEIQSYLNQFSFQNIMAKDVGKLKVFSNKRSVLTYDQSKSETYFSTEDTPDLENDDVVPDDKIHIKADALLKLILKDEAENYCFINFEKTLAKKSEFEAPQPIAYYANYERIIDGRPVLSGDFRVRICYGKGGALKEFSIRKPIIHKVSLSLLLSTKNLPKKLSALAENQPDLKTPTGPISVLVCRPLNRVSSYLSVAKGGGSYLIPHISFLTEFTLDPFLVHSTQPEGTPISYLGRLNIPEVD